jgi:nicotinamide-nucleotide adenylyltransferase
LPDGRHRALFLGRFQPYHDGHEAVVRRIAAEVDELIIAIGSAQYSHTIRDPFTAGERILMITQMLSDDPVFRYVLPIEDIEQNSLYVPHIKRLTPDFDVVYSNNPLVIRLFEEAAIPVKEMPRIDRRHLWGTRIRQLMIDGDEWRQYVPAPVADVIHQIGGIERIRTIHEDDQFDEEEQPEEGTPLWR